MKLYLLGLSAMALAGSMTSAFSADVTMPDPNYATATAVMNVIKAAAEQELGLQISTVTTTAVPVIWEAMDRNKGEVDIWPDTWLPNQQGLVDKYVKDKKSVKLAENSYEAQQGYCVTEVTYDKFGIKNVSDLANPDNAKIFDRDGDGKGNIWIGAPGWQSTNIEKVRARDYGFADFFNLEATDEAISNATLDSAAKQDKPWVGYCYGPHQNFARYKLKFLAEPAYDPAKFVVVQANEDPQWFEKSKISSAYAKTTVHIAYASSLADRQPDLVAALERMQFNPDDVSKWAYSIIVDKKPADEVAKDWIKANPEAVSKWFGH
ncbi:glycine betaine ABC transporter substrate-binding protein [Mesorhizobium sp. VK25A]|uniref:Glycine betaine ABC transporter substrate-binding protein n=1 Tax=Mesorhizobium vachelliae TaxID=3072309 RepID=A0ABU5A9F2_9HYPH|nr:MULTISPECIES: glycine betaine ABC transporter substrate-binding protein [unclassified Mesorhizobium]MDX8533262.1 glycine betaine ABC transporter substrate-binding protein [Mesorhizobium sp. VK25D]MDX8545181.1 glycine betaine ABC transporter substrate-binding protein [Mesorhizobium sp. VK25A]